MGLRRRKDEGKDEKLDELANESELEVEELVPSAPTVSNGPWDLDNLPEDDRERIDFGGLQVWLPEGVDLRIDFAETGEIAALTIAVPAQSGDPDAMQLSAFAAPRSAGIWDEVRAEIAEGISAAGGRSEEAAGSRGPELRARLNTDQPGVFAPARFLGIDGPRWFLRALITGPSAVQGDNHPLLAAALEQVVVVRGSDAMAPRDPLPLIPPPALAEQMAAAMQAAQEQQEQT